MAKKKTEEVAETVETPAEETAVSENVEAVDTAGTETQADEKAAAKAAAPATNDAAGSNADENEQPTIAKGKRMEKIGVVASDKMEKTVTVRVDRLVKHPRYRKYVRRRKKFMAHDETGAKPGDKVRIVETRPTSARKRWRVVEILQKAER